MSLSSSFFTLQFAVCDNTCVQCIEEDIIKLENNFKRCLISNFRCVLNVVCFLLGNSPASDFYMPKFRNTLSVPSSQVGRYEDGAECSETSAYKIQTPGNYPEETIQF